MTCPTPTNAADDADLERAAPNIMDTTPENQAPTFRTGRTAMSTIYGITELGPTTAKRQVYSPLEIYWNAFQEWRKRERLRTQLWLLTDSELRDIGITRGEIDYVASNRSIDPTGFRST